MKLLFEYPSLKLEKFTVKDNTLFLSGVLTDEDELARAYGNTLPITTK